MNIKSVVTALPNHIMSCYRLPRTVTKKFMSAVAQLLWSPGDTKNLTDYDMAMLAKQLWQLIEKLNTLFSRVFKGRYFKKASLMETIRSYSPSYGWRSIICLDL